MRLLGGVEGVFSLLLQTLRVGVTGVGVLNLPAGLPGGVLELVGDAGVVLVLNPKPFVFFPGGDIGDADGGGGHLRLTGAGVTTLGLLMGAPSEIEDFFCPTTEEPTEGV